MRMYKEVKTIQLRFIVMMIIMVGAAIAIVALKNFAVGMLNSPMMQEYLKNSPYKNVLSLINKLSNDFSYYTYSQWFGKNYVQLAALTAIVFSFPVFSKEREKRTIYLLIGRMNRWEIYSSKISVGYLSVASVMFAGSFGYLLTAYIMKYSLSFSMMFSWTMMATIGTLLLYQIGTYTSLIFKDQIKPFLLDLVIYIGIYVSSLFKQTKFLDLFGYMSRSDVLKGAGIAVFPTIVILSVCAAIFIGEYFQFKYMDL